MAGELEVQSIEALSGKVSITPGTNIDAASANYINLPSVVPTNTFDSSALSYDPSDNKLKYYNLEWVPEKVISEIPNYKQAVQPGLLIDFDASYSDCFPPSGNKIYNLKRNQYNGTNSNVTLSTLGDGSMFFDGTASVTSGSVPVGDQYTIEFVFYSTAVQNFRNPVDMNYTTYSGVSGNVGPRFEQYDSYSGLTNAGVWVWSGVTTANNPYNVSDYFSITPNTWNHMAFVMDNGSVTTYQNNTQIGTVRSSPNGYVTTFGDVRLGRGFVLDASRWFKGNIPIFRLYNRNLSVDELTTNFNLTKDRFGL